MREAPAAGDLARRDPPDLAPALLLTADDLARELRLSVKTIRRLDQSGRLPRPVRVGHAVRWPRDTIVRWLAAGAPDRETWELYDAAPAAKGRRR